MQWITELLRLHPELAIYFTLGIGFLIGKIHIKGFSLGIVTSVLLGGVLIGQLDIPMTGALKQTAFLLFLFAGCVLRTPPVIIYSLAFGLRLRRA